MIIGELIGIIASITIWTLFIIGVFGLNKEFGKDIMEENPALIALFLVFTIFGFACGIMAFAWFFITTGWGDILMLMLDEFWNTVI